MKTQEPIIKEVLTMDVLSGAFNALFKKPVKVPRLSAGFGVSGGMRI
ncbi:hypothetical protein V7O66_02955 [Methanolobus sp. ZRKC3]